MLSKDTLLVSTIPFLDEILYHCHEAGEDPALVLAIIQTESRFRENAVSKKGAVGLMQVMPDTGRWMASKLLLVGYEDERLFERVWNLRIGISYMAYLNKQFGDQRPQAVAAYNAGPARVRIWLKNGDWDGTFERVGDIPYKETREYVKKVMRLYDVYRMRIEP